MNLRLDKAAQLDTAFALENTFKYRLDIYHHNFDHPSKGEVPRFDIPTTFLRNRAINSGIDYRGIREVTHQFLGRPYDLPKY